MLLNCPQCRTQYRLDPVLLGQRARKVRCTSCGNIWVQPAPELDSGDLIIPALPEMEVEFQDPRAAQKQEVESFASLLRDDIPSGIPESVKPIPQGLQPAIVTHRPMGMGAGAFGCSVFLLLLFLTLGPALLFKTVLVRTWPALDAFYHLAGVRLQAPGEGLRFSEMTATQKISDEGKVFALHAKLTNVSEREVPYPALEVVVQDVKGQAKTWRFDAPQTTLKAGETIPLDLDLDDAPAEGRTARLRVTGP